MQMLLVPRYSIEIGREKKNIRYTLHSTQSTAKKKLKKKIIFMERIAHVPQSLTRN